MDLLDTNIFFIITLWMKGQIFASWASAFEKFQVGHWFEMNRWPESCPRFCRVGMKVVEVAKRYYQIGMGDFFTTILSGNRSVQHEEKLQISTGGASYFIDQGVKLK